MPSLQASDPNFPHKESLSAAAVGFFYIVQHNQAKPMWRNVTRNGLKIEVLAIFLLFKIDQIEPNLPG